MRAGTSNSKSATRQKSFASKRSTPRVDSKKRITFGGPGSILETDNNFYKDTFRALLARNKNKVVIDEEDVTPKLMNSSHFDEKFQSLHQFSKAGQSERALQRSFSQTFSQTFANTMKTSLEDIMSRISLNVTSMVDIPFWRAAGATEETIRRDQKQPPYIKVHLRETDNIILYQKASTTVPKGSEEAVQVEEDNKYYEELTQGKKKIRRRNEAEAQTTDILYKSRDVNTESIKTLNVGSFVSNYDMFDTYKDLEKETASVEFEDKKTLEITTYKVRGVDQYAEISKSPNFQLATMLMQRILAGNVFRTKQKRFRNMSMPDPLSIEVKYHYTLEKLWKFRKQSVERRAVSSIHWCPNNGDIVAIAYGVYTFVPVKNQTTGYICIWSIKNPVNPERRYDYPVPVVSLQFSPYNPQLIAIGFYDGSVEIRDITMESGPPVAISERNTSPGCEPITQIRWIIKKKDNDKESNQFLAISQDGTVTKYLMTNSPYLIGFQQMKLDRVEGAPEGLNFLNKPEHIMESNRHPQALTLTLHPNKADLYFVLTDEGCLHKCSINHPQQHMELLKAHQGCVYAMEFSPWSPKLFLTCGSDWCIRIWLEGILEPLVKLSSGIGPVHMAYWSPTHSTVIVGITRKAVEIWDIRRNLLQPVSTKSFNKSYLTVARFSNCGRSIVVGNEGGDAFLCAFEDMPFPSYFQYTELESAIMKAIMAFPELTKEVKSLGFWGYADSDKPIK